MVVGTSGHLGQMRDSQHLAVAPQLFHQAAHGFGHSTAHARVHFVKDEGLGRAQLAGGDGNGQSDARQLATRGHLPHRPRRAACMTGHQKLHLLQAMAGGLWQGF